MPSADPFWYCTLSRAWERVPDPRAVSVGLDPDRLDVQVLIEECELNSFAPPTHFVPTERHGGIVRTRRYLTQTTPCRSASGPVDVLWPTSRCPDPTAQAELACLVCGNNLVTESRSNGMAGEQRDRRSPRWAIGMSSWTSAKTVGGTRQPLASSRSFDQAGSPAESRPRRPLSAWPIRQVAGDAVKLSLRGERAEIGRRVARVADL